MNLTPDDHRRAAAIVIHHGTANIDGINEILADAEGRATELLLSVLGLYGTLVPELRTPTGQNFMASYVLELAGIAIEDLGLGGDKP